MGNTSTKKGGKKCSPKTPTNKSQKKMDTFFTRNTPINKLGKNQEETEEHPFKTFSEEQNTWIENLIKRKVTAELENLMVEANNNTNTLPQLPQQNTYYTLARQRRDLRHAQEKLNKHNLPHTATSEDATSTEPGQTLETAIEEPDLQHNNGHLLLQSSTVKNKRNNMLDITVDYNAFDTSQKKVKNPGSSILSEKKAKLF